MADAEKITEYNAEELMDFSAISESDTSNEFNDSVISHASEGSDNVDENTPADRRSRRRRRAAAQAQQESKETEAERQHAELQEALRSARKEAQEKQATAGILTEAEKAAVDALESAEEAAAAALLKEETDILPPNVLSKDCKVSRLIGSKRYFDSLIVSPFKPTVAEESAFLQKITENFDWKFNTGGSFFINSGSNAFNKEFQKVMLSYVRMERGEFPILIYDSTVRSTGKYGFVLTNRYFHFHTRELIPYKFKLSRIRNLVVDFGDTCNDWSTLKIRQLGSDFLVPVFRSINADRVIEVTDVLLRMLYHMLSYPHLSLTVNGIMPYKFPEPEVKSGFFGFIDFLLDKLFHKKPDFDIPGRPYTSDFHITKLNKARIEAGLDPLSKTSPTEDENEDEADNSEESTDKKGKKGNKNSKEKKGNKGKKSQKEDSEDNNSKANNKNKKSKNGKKGKKK